VDVTLTIPDPAPITAVNCSACVRDVSWLDPFEVRPSVPDEGGRPELGAVALSVPPHARAKTERPMAIPNRRWTQDM
jgi:hypothetical protein